MSSWFENSPIWELRLAVGETLEKEDGLPPSKDENEKAAGFWERVEKAGYLEKALKLYDQFDEERAAWVHRPRETKKMFAERIEREGRQAEVEAARMELLEDGYSLREIHEKLVWKFQALDKNWTRPWTTPDPWEKGRLFRKKEDQEQLLTLGNPDDIEDDEDKARWRVDCAKWRREERVALANARRRARDLEAAAEAKKAEEAKAVAKGKSSEETKSDKPKVKEPAGKVKNKNDSANPEDEPRIHGKWVVVVGPSGYENKWVPEAKS